jgi:6-phosphogluconolactonase (cycloisomerase 2 family)
LLVATLVGCGGSGGPASDGAPAAGGPGRLTLRIAREDGPLGVRVTGPGEVSFSVSSSTQTVVVFVEDLQSGDPIITPVSVQLENVFQQTVTIDQVPAGTWLLRLELFDSQNALVATGQTQVTVQAGQVASATVTLTPTSSPSPSPSPSPTSNLFLFTANSSAGTLGRYSVDSASGSLTELLPSTSVAPASQPRFMATSSNQFLFVAYNSGHMDAYSIDSSGGLTRAPGMPVVASTPSGGLAVHPQFNKVYVGVQGDLEIFDFDPTTGALSNPSTFVISSSDVVRGLAVAPGVSHLFLVTGGGDVASVFLDPTGQPTGSPLFQATVGSTGLDLKLFETGGGGFIYVSTAADQIVRFTFDSSGLIQSQASFSTTGALPFGLCLHPANTALYAAESSGAEVEGFSINPTTGDLTSSGTQSTSPTNPIACAVDPTGSFLYALGSASSGSGLIHGFSTASTGALTPLGTTPHDGTGAAALVVIQK